MSIKTAVKEHFTHGPISAHWEYFFAKREEEEAMGLISTDNGLSIGEFSLKDMDKCAELYKKVFSTDPWYDEWVSQHQTINYLNELVRNPAFYGFVALENDEIVGVCLGHRRSWWTGKEFFVDEFFVANDQQGNGIGTKLLNTVTDYLLDEGYTRLTLLTNKGIPAEDFYLKNGFYNNQKRTVMVKNL